jgi:glycosyltransferase involved in cell wall biosynthesis
LHDPKLILPVSIYSIIFRSKLIVVEHNANQIKKRSEWWASKQSMWLADHVVVLTQDYYNELKKELSKKFNQNKTTIIPNGINTIQYSPAVKNSLGNERCIIGMAARFTPTKDYNMLIRCFEVLLKKYPAIQLVLAGNGDTFEGTRKYVQKQNCNSQITFLGSINEIELIDYYKSLDIYAHASLAETMSTSIMQAMACGLPIVASNIAGINNIIENGVNGLLYNNEMEFIDALESLIKNAQLRQRLSANARFKANENLSSDRMYLSYLELIKGRK